MHKLDLTRSHSSWFNMHLESCLPLTFIYINLPLVIAFLYFVSLTFKHGHNNVCVAQIGKCGKYSQNQIYLILAVKAIQA